jgi:hypothetical protein
MVNVYQRVAGQRPKADPQVLPWWGERWHKPVFLLFLVCWTTGALIALFWRDLPGDWTKIVLISALLTSLITLGRQLPVQNVIAAGCLFGLAGAGWAEFTHTAIDDRGTTWQTTAFWTVILVNCRGAAQFCLQVRRASRFYGWELTGVSACAFTLAVIFERAILYKLAPLVVLISFPGTAALMVLSLPLLMNKRPVEPPVSSQPIVVLLTLLAWAFLRQV